MIQFLQQTIAKLIVVIAGLIIAVGIVKMPATVNYEAPSSRPVSQEITEKSRQQPQTPPPVSVKPKPLPKKEPSQPKIAATTTPPLTQPETPPAPVISLTELNTKARKTIVNILCATQAGGSFKPITGSGVIISSKGVILTTAHIGQYFLLENEPAASYLDCIIRAGDIAMPAYDVKLLYIPSVWIEKNAENIIQQEPKGTGENDYALLLINSALSADKILPPDFPTAKPNLDFENLPENLSVLLASYPAGFIGGIEVQKNLGLTSTFAPIKALYTFTETGPTTLDLFSLGGNIVAQGGSSGGGVFDTHDGKLLGIIVTSTDATTTAGRILNAITIPYIKQSFEKYTRENLASFLDNPAATEVLPTSEFNRLKNLLVAQLERR
ncbi:MAG: serine protease [bacterium]|nr:serine protease [bacterium]